ncbi:MAG: alpha/beta hydrolase family protein [Woeseiaceae bacterium]
MKKIVIGLLLLIAASAGAESSIPLKLHDGVTLDATYYSASAPGPGVLFLNMCDPSRDQSEWKSVATTLSDKGYHVLTFDYRGFGRSEGERPTNLRSIDEAMPYWRENWMADIQAAYDTLVAQPGVRSDAMGIAAASCGVFLGLEFSLANRNIKSLVFLGGPTDKSQRERLPELEDVPILLISGNMKGPNESQGTLEWSDEVFAASTHPDTRFLKYKTETYGTRMFEHHPVTEDMLVDWFANTIER